MFGGIPFPHADRSAPPDHGGDSNAAAASSSPLASHHHTSSASSDFGDFHSAATAAGDTHAPVSLSPATVTGDTLSPSAASPGLSPARGTAHAAHAAAHSPPSLHPFPHRQHSPARLDSGDLLGSFDDVDHDTTASGMNTEPPLAAPPFGQGLDLFADDDDLTPIGSPPAQAASQIGLGGGAPLRRLTSRSSVSGSPTHSRVWSSEYPDPSSPPRVTDAHILIQAPQHRAEDAASEFRRIRRMSDQYAASGRLPPSRASTMPRSAHHSPTRLSSLGSGSLGAGSGGSSARKALADAFSTTKLASKWKRSVLGNATFGGDDGPTKTALPIDVSHKSPFATASQVSGSYVPPSGAPGFVPAATGHADEDEEYTNTQLTGRRELTEPVLQVQQARELRAMLPPRQRLSDSWDLIFSLDQHGASLSTLYRQTEKYAAAHRTGGNLLVVKDSEGHVFGIFLNEPIMKREGTYYGSGESFMFKFQGGQSKPRVFRWTGRNNYIALCESTFISFGGGGNSYGLILDATFSRNSSSTSPAFDNDVLCNAGSGRSEHGQPFDCIGLEVWGTAL